MIIGNKYILFLYILLDDMIYIANIGDSRAILSLNGG
jgi:serine/threonine protein phosphatase PrpC